MAYRLYPDDLPGVFKFPKHKSYRPELKLDRQADGSCRFTTPKRITWLADVERLPDLVDLAYPFVSARLRDLIERFDPGIHAFHSVRTRMTNGEVEHRFLLEVGRRIDGISREHSNWSDYHGMWWRPPPCRRKRLVLDARVIGGAHLWEEANLPSDMNPIASDELAQAARDAGMTGVLLRHYRQTNKLGSYRWAPLPSNRIYSIGEQPRFRSNRWPTMPDVHYLDGQPDQVRFLAGRVRKPMQLVDAPRHMRFLDPSTVPTRARFRDDMEGPLPDILTNIYRNLPLTVSVRLRDLIERYEPGVHQFLPLSLEDSDGGKIEQRFVATFAPGPADAFRSTRRVPHTPGAPISPEGERTRVVASKQAIAGRHVWGGDEGRSIIVSNEVASYIEDAGWPHLHFSGIRVND